MTERMTFVVLRVEAGDSLELKLQFVFRAAFVRLE